MCAKIKYLNPQKIHNIVTSTPHTKKKKQKTEKNKF